MPAVKDCRYIVVVQCQIAMQRCSGYGCERAFTERQGGFADLPAEGRYRILYMDCGGCCGKTVLRRLQHVCRQAARDGIDKGAIVVQLASCLTKDNYHSPRCPHAEYIRELVARAGLKCREDTVISATAERRRADGTYRSSRTAGRPSRRRGRQAGGVP